MMGSCDDGGDADKKMWRLNYIQKKNDVGEESNGVLDDVYVMIVMVVTRAMKIMGRADMKIVMIVMMIQMWW